MLKCAIDLGSLVEGEHPVADAAPPGGNSGDTPEATMVLHDPLHHVLMSTIAEGSVSRHLTIAELVVAALGDVEGHGAVPSDNPLALTVAEGTDLRVTTTAPIVDFAAGQVEMSRIDTGERGHGWRSIAALFVGSALAERHDSLLGEVSDIIHGDAVSGSGRTENLGLRREYISLVRLHLAAGRALEDVRVRK